MVQAFPEGDIKAIRDMIAKENVTYVIRCFSLVLDITLTFPT
jgi:hypothetical protein